MIDFLQDGVLPDDFSRAKKLTAQESLFALVDGILYYIDVRCGSQKRVAVPSHLENNCWIRATVVSTVATSQAIGSTML